MNTRKQVLIMSALLLVMLITIGVYAAWYPSRAEDAEAHFEELTAERASILFARNCRLCHGDLAEGGALGGRLTAAPALDRTDLQGFADSDAKLSANVQPAAKSIAVTNATKFKGGSIILIDEERMEVLSVNGNNLSVVRAVGHTEAAGHASGSAVFLQDPAVLQDRIRLITNTIMCGRVGSAMPAWGQAQGGPLSDEQIRQLSVLITQGRWDLVEHEIAIEDKLATKTNIKGEATDWAKLTEAMSPDTISMRVTDVTPFNEKEAIRIGEERLRVTAVPKLAANEKDKSGIIQVERGILGTSASDHAPEETIYRFPEVSEPAILQSSCGQTARPQAPAEPPGLIEPFEGQTVSVVAQNLLFQPTTITVRTGGQVRVRLDNRDNGVDHNIAFYTSKTNLTPVSVGAIGTTFKGLAVDDTAFAVPAAGSYYFRCDVHPTTMEGTFTVQ